MPSPSRKKSSRSKAPWYETALVVLGKLFISPFRILLSFIGLAVVGAKFILLFIGAIVAMILLATTLIFKEVLHVDISLDIPPNTVLKLTLDGPLDKTDTGFNFKTLIGKRSRSLLNITRAIRHASSDPHVVGLVTYLESNDFKLAHLQELRSAITAFRKSGKYALIYAPTFGGSGQGSGTLSYYLASGHDEIWLQHSGIVGITGLSMEVPFARKALDKWKIEPRIIRRYEYKNAPNTFIEESMTAPQREAMEAIVKSHMEQIVKAIQEGREMQREEVMELINKAPWFGEETKRLGLVNKIAWKSEVKPFLKEKFGEDIHEMEVEKYFKRSETAINTHNVSKKIQLLKVRFGSTLNAKKIVRIALINASGIIVSSSGNTPLNPSKMRTGEIIKLLRTIREKDTHDAIILRIECMGGMPVPSHALWHELKITRDAGKPIIVTMGHVAASAGYLIATSANKIVAQPSTLTGSIGVFSGKIFTGNFWKELGVQWDHVSIGDNATVWSNSQDFTPQGKKRFDEWVTHIYDQFVKIVAKERGLTLEHVQEIAKGRVWTGEHAKKFGLVDALGGLEVAIDLVFKELNLPLDTPFDIETLPEKPSFIKNISLFVKGRLAMSLTEVGHFCAQVFSQSFMDSAQKLQYGLASYSKAYN